MKKEEIEILESQGCVSDDWNKVSIAEGVDLGRIRNVYFSGPVSVGKGSEIINVPGGLSNVRIGEGARIVNVARIENSPGATYGVGIDIAVLDETGTRPVRIYPGLSAQIATMAARLPEYAEGKLLPLITRHIIDMPDMAEIGDGAEVIDCGPITDVRIWPGSKVEGVLRLHNGSIVCNARSEESGDKSQGSGDKGQGSGDKGQETRVKSQGSGDKSQGSRDKSQGSRDKSEESRENSQETRSLTYVGHGVDAENFIIEDATVTGGSILRNTYVGQGCVIDKGFTSHDSLFFANCTMENGEACAVLAGPFTVSMHKSSLLIGCHTGFMNAGSGTNMSNHMYKNGPVHWGVLERGVKTSSNSYIMHGSRIGAYSLVMGEHKNHPDSSDFPFSYLFGDSSGNTIVVPGAMLRSYGLKRDEEKWPKRDGRLQAGIPLHDRITYKTLNPYTVNMILDAIEISEKLLSVPEDSEGYIGYKGLKIKKKSLEKGRRLYELALCKYLQTLHDKDLPEERLRTGKPSRRWVDLSGQVIAESNFNEIINAGSIKEMEDALDKASKEFEANERMWLADRMKDRIDSSTITALRAPELDALIEKDRTNSLAQIAKENDMLAFI